MYCQSFVGIYLVCLVSTQSGHLLIIIMLKYKSKEYPICGQIMNRKLIT